MLQLFWYFGANGISVVSVVESTKWCLIDKLPLSHAAACLALVLM